MEVPGLVWALQSKGYAVLPRESEKSRVIRFKTSQEKVAGWVELINKFNQVFGQAYDLKIFGVGSEERVLEIQFLTPYEDGDKLAKEINLLTSAIAQDEFSVYETMDGKTFDLKLGISCNNNCIHCVIKPIVLQMKKENPDRVKVDTGFGMWCEDDLDYQEIVNILGKQEDGTLFVITGGEPTIRNELIPVLKNLYYAKPRSKIAIQTNGRNLSNEKLVKGIRRFTRNGHIFYVIAIHGMEETHNRIVNNRKDTGNPYQETLQGLRNTVTYFGHECIRIEIVLSHLNLKELAETVRFQYEEMGMRYIGISYPHLDGFPGGAIQNLAPSFNDVFPVLEELNEFVKEHPDLRLLFEEIPLCIFSKLQGEIPLGTMGSRCRENTVMNFMGKQNDDFQSSWLRDHAKFSYCEDCVMNAECPGVWKENRDLNESSCTPILQVSDELQRFINERWV